MFRKFNVLLTINHFFQVFVLSTHSSISLSQLSGPELGLSLFSFCFMDKMEI